MRCTSAGSSSQAAWYYLFPPARWRPCAGHRQPSISWTHLGFAVPTPPASIDEAHLGRSTAEAPRVRLLLRTWDRETTVGPLCTWARCPRRLLAPVVGGLAHARNSGFKVDERSYVPRGCGYVAGCRARLLSCGVGRICRYSGDDAIASVACECEGMHHVQKEKPAPPSLRANACVLAVASCVLSADARPSPTPGADSQSAPVHPQSASQSEPQSAWTAPMLPVGDADTDTWRWAGWSDVQSGASRRLAMPRQREPVVVIVHLEEGADREATCFHQIQAVAGVYPMRPSNARVRMPCRATRCACLRFAGCDPWSEWCEVGGPRETRPVVVL